MLRTVTIATLLLTVADQARPAQAKWEDQMREMGYLIMQISTINAVNSMGLTTGQARQLRAMVKQVEAAGARVPRPRGTRDPRLEQVRSTYGELRAVLLKQQPVSGELEARVVKARTLESQVIRESMQIPPAPSERGNACTSCHAAPRKASPAESAAADTRLRTLRSQKRKTFMAHAIGLYGVQGLRQVGLRAPQIDRLLNASQREIIQKFACCLIPPQELSNPVRAGQADVSERAMKLIRTVRNTDDKAWPWVKGILLKRLGANQKAKTPGINSQDQQKFEQHLEGLFAKVRGMPDVDFEVEKEDLCRQLKGDSLEEDERPQRTKVFMAAYFLLVPGMGEVYSDVIRRQ